MASEMEDMHATEPEPADEPQQTPPQLHDFLQGPGDSGAAGSIMDPSLEAATGLEKLFQQQGVKMSPGILRLRSEDVHAHLL